MTRLLEAYLQFQIAVKVGKSFRPLTLHRLAIKLDTTVLRLWTQSSNVWPFGGVHAWVLARRSCLWMVSGPSRLCGRAKNMD